MSWKEKLRNVPIIGGFFTDIETALKEEAAEHGPMSPVDALDAERVARVALRADHVIRRNGRGPLLDSAKAGLRDVFARMPDDEEEEEITVTQVDDEEEEEAEEEESEVKG